MQIFRITKGATSIILPISIFDSSSTTGAKLAGLVYNTASLTAYYNRSGAAGAAVAITLATATKGTWATGGFIAIDGTNMPGDYELHIPDAALATGANTVLVQLKGATNMVPKNILIELTSVDMQDAQRGGMTALPASGTLAVNPILNATQTGVTIPTVTTLTGHTAQTGDCFARLGAPAGASVSADVAAVKVDTAAVLADTGTDGVVVAAASKSGYALSAAGVQAIWDALTSALTTVGSVGKKLADWVVGSLNADQSAVTVGTVTTVTTTTNLTNAPTAGDLTAAMKASVNAEVLDVLNVDTFAEPGQEAPAATNTLVKKIGYLFKFLRNKVAQNATTLSVYADDGITVDQKATVFDDATTYTRGEIGTGP